MLQPHPVHLVLDPLPRSQASHGTVQTRHMSQGRVNKVPQALTSGLTLPSWSWNPAQDSGEVAPEGTPLGWSELAAAGTSGGGHFKSASTLYSAASRPEDRKSCKGQQRTSLN